MKDPYMVLGKAAPIFRAIFSGVNFPIQNRDDLINKAGGKERLIAVSDSDGIESVYSLMDLIDAFPQMDELFPSRTANSFVKKFATIEQRRRQELKTSPLSKIKGKNISGILKERPLLFPANEPEIPFFGLPKRSATGASTISAFTDRQSMQILARLPRDFAEVMIDYVKSVFELIIVAERRAALAAAASAEQQANNADNAANTALDATQDVGASVTNEQAQQAVDLACASANEAADSAQQAANFAAQACAHAGAIPSDVEAQTACSNARAAASRAQAAADRARGACWRARDIASIGMATICGHVTETDPCCDDNWSGATIVVCNLTYPEIPCQTDVTDGNGNYCVTGRFGHSSRVGCSIVTVTMNAGANGGDVSYTRQIIVCTSSPPRVNFSFDAPGSE